MEIINKNLNVFIHKDISEIFKNISDDYIIITDNIIFELYSKYLSNYQVIIIHDGEEDKNFSSIIYIQEQLLLLGANRNTKLIGFGGGVITDITGFAAAIFMRGIEHILVPTTLLAMCDASVGGKNGINVDKTKNICGTFKQAESIHISLQVLSTLPPEEILNGWAEIIKIALVLDKELFDHIKSIQNIYNFDSYKSIIIKAINLKVKVIEKDFSEQGIRKILNFGHTIGHCLEVCNNISHGLAVSQGIRYASLISHKLSLLSDTEFHSIIALLDKFGFENIRDIDNVCILKHLLRDKKKEKDHISFILLDTIGGYKMKNFTSEQLIKYIN